MNALKHPSLGYLSGLLMIGAASALVGCGGGDDAAGASKRAGSEQAGSPGDSSATGGSSTGSGGSSGSAKAGSSSKGDDSDTTKGSGGSSAGADSSGGSDGSLKNGGSSSGGSNSAGSAGTTGDHVVNKPKNEAYAIAATKPARCLPKHLSNGSTGPARDPDCTLQPMMSAELTLSPRDEISLLAPAKNNAFALTLDDTNTGFAALAATPLPRLSDLTILDTTSGNVDDDGNAELVVAGIKSDGSLVIRVVDSHTVPGAQNQRDNRLFTAAQDIAVASPDGVSSPYMQVSVHVGDVDQDGRDELLVTAKTKDGHLIARVYDDSAAGYQALAVPYAAAGKEIAGVFGNFDDDPAPELALLIDTGKSSDVGANIELHVLDDYDQAFAPLRSTLVGADTGLIFGSNLASNHLELVVGNFDDDPQEELVALADGYDSGKGSVDAIEPALFMVMLDTDASAGTPAFVAVKKTQQEFPAPRQNSSNGGYVLPSTPGWHAVVADTRPQVAAQNKDGKLGTKLDEVFVVETVEPEDQGSGYDVKLFHQTYGSTAWGSPVITLASNVNSPSFSLTAAAGNLTNLASDLLVAIRSGTTLTPLRVYSQPSNTDPISYALVKSALPAQTVTNEDAGVFVTGGDYDADALRVRFTGNRHQELTNPEPIVVLAAPPVNGAIEQDADNSSTHYGESTSHSKDQTTEYSVTDNLTLSTEIDMPIIDIVGVTASYSMSRSFSNSETTTSTTTYTESTDITYPYEGVIFNGTLCEVYEYVIVGANDASMLGQKLNVNEPIATKSFAWTVDHYNSVLASSKGGPNASPIDGSILNHEIGDPASYPTAPQAGANSFLSKLMTVGDRGVQRTAQIDLESGQENSAGTTDESSVGGGSTGIVGIQYTHSWSTTGSYSWSTGHSLSYSGTVGGIDPDDQEFGYSFGVWVHNATLKNGEQVQVVDYYSDAANLPAYGGH